MLREAESEYGGSKELEKADFNLDHIYNFYYSGIKITELINSKYKSSDLEFLTLPSKIKLKRRNISSSLVIFRKMG